MQTQNSVACDEPFPLLLSSSKHAKVNFFVFFRGNLGKMSDKRGIPAKTWWACLRADERDVAAKSYLRSTTSRRSTTTTSTITTK